MQGIAIVGGNLLMAFCAHLQVVGRSLVHAGMGLFLRDPGLVTVVARTTSIGQVRVLYQEFGIHQVALVVVFRPDRRRCPRSPRSFNMDLRRDNQGFHLFAVRVTGDTGARGCGWGEERDRNKTYNKEKDVDHILHVRYLTMPLVRCRQLIPLDMHLYTPISRNHTDVRHLPYQ